MTPSSVQKSRAAYRRGQQPESVEGFRQWKCEMDGMCLDTALARTKLFEYSLHFTGIQQVNEMSTSYTGS
jgi:hypothetical protein